MKNDIDVLRGYGLCHVANVLESCSEVRWNVWKELDPSRGIVNVGVFGYDKEIFPLHIFALPGGIITGSHELHNELTKYGIEPKFHSWYQDNVFFKMACIPTELIKQRNLLRYNTK